MTKAFGRGIMLSRRTLDAERSILTVPAGVLLALLCSGRDEHGHHADRVPPMAYGTIGR